MCTFYRKRNPEYIYTYTYLYVYHPIIYDRLDITQLKCIRCTNDIFLIS